MKLNKKTILTIFTLISLASIAFLFIASNRDKKSIPIDDTNFEKKLDIPNYFENSKIDIKNNINKNDFNFPPELPYLQLINSFILNNNQIKKVSNNLGFTTDPIEFTDIKDGKVMIWNGEKTSLTITPKINQIFLSSNDTIRTLVKNSQDLKVSDTDFQTISRNFLTEKIGINESDLNFIGFSYYKIDNGIEYLAKTTKENADVYQLDYSQSQSTYPIYTQDPSKSQLSIQFLKNGTIISFNGNIGLRFENSINRYRLKNFEEFNTEIDKSILVSVNDNNINISDYKTSDFSNTQVNKISLVYLLESSATETLQPVFLLEGTTDLKGFNKPVNVLMYLPAFKGNN